MSRGETVAGEEGGSGARHKGHYVRQRPKFFALGEGDYEGYARELLTKCSL